MPNRCRRKCWQARCCRRAEFAAGHGQSRYARAQNLTRDIGIELSTFDQFAPWFTAEAISQVQLGKSGSSRNQAWKCTFWIKRVPTANRLGLETVRDQIALFESMSMDAQVQYPMSSLEQARDLPKQVDSMVRAWRRGDTDWFETQLKSELGNDPAVYQTLVVARNRKWPRGSKPCSPMTRTTSSSSAPPIWSVATA